MNTMRSHKVKNIESIVKQRLITIGVMIIQPVRDETKSENDQTKLNRFSLRRTVYDTVGTTMYKHLKDIKSHGFSHGTKKRGH